MARPIDDLKDETYRLGDLSLGSIQERWLTCGKENCKCSRGEKHGPYYYFVYTDTDRNSRQISIDPDEVDELEERINNYAEFQDALHELIEREVEQWEST